MGKMKKTFAINFPLSMKWTVDLFSFFFSLFCFLLYPLATSVSVSAWTLVAISVERYYAICHPLRSRRWQTLKHAYKLIILVWFSSLLFMLPIAALSKLIPTSQGDFQFDLFSIIFRNLTTFFFLHVPHTPIGHRKCRELWPEEPIEYEKVFNIFLDMFLLVLPLFVLFATYFMITKTLWQGIRTERDFKDNLTNYSKCLCKYLSFIVHSFNISTSLSNLHIYVFNT